MSRVERIELFHVEVPLPKPFHPSWLPGYPQTHARSTLLRLTTDDGLVGVSAGTAFAGEREGLGDLLGGFLLGVRADDLETVRARLREVSFLGWRNWWIEAAFWDLVGQLRGQPVYRLLQERPETVERVRVYASSGEVRPIERRRAWLDQVRRMGIDAVKLRVKDPARRDDVSTVAAARRELGDRFVLGVDANQGWAVSLFDPTPRWDLDYATEVGKAYDDLGVAWLEEPLAMHDWEGMAALRKRIRTPLSGAELHGDWHEVRPLLDHGCLDRYQPDATFCGGLTVSRQIMAACRERGLDFSPHTWTTGIGLLVNLHAFAAWEKRDWLEYPYEPPGWVPEAREGVIAPIEVAPDGTIAVPQEPGLGIHLDERRLRRFARRFYLATPLRVALKTIREKGLRTALDLKRRKAEVEGGRPAP
jgi:L-alanine-DL-glutamate epimerase-like enolase superfamily enzyme